MAAHSRTLAWRIPWTEEPGGLRSMGRKESGMTEQLTLSLSQLQSINGFNGGPLLTPALSTEILILAQMLREEQKLGTTPDLLETEARTASWCHHLLSARSEEILVITRPGPRGTPEGQASRGFDKSPQ